MKRLRQALTALSAPLLLTFGYVYITGTAGIATAYTLGGKVVAVGADLGWAAASYGFSVIKGAADVIGVCGAAVHLREWRARRRKGKAPAAGEAVSAS